MTLDISATSPRVQYTVGSSSTTTFAYGFPIFQDADLKVFVGSTLKTLTTHYTVTGAGTTSGGNVVMTTGNAVTNADVTIVRDITISRTTDFPTSGSFQVDSLNTELDTITAVQQELEDDISRSLKLSDEDATATLTLPLKDARKGRYLAFNATTGNAEAGPTQTDATLIATVTSDIATLADIQDGTTATNAITTLASIHGNVTTVANVASNVTTIATGTTGGNSNLTNLNTIATGTTGGNANLTQINAVAGKITEIGRLGTADAVADLALLGTSDVVADMALLATTDVIADMALLADADVISDMNTLATSDIISDLNTLATSDIVTDMNLLATSANVTAMGHLGTSANVTAMGHLGTSANVTAMGLLGTSAVVEDMGFLGTSANVTAMGLLGTSAVVEDMGFLGTSANVTAMGNLGTSTNVTNMANLNASGVISNIATVAGAVSNVNTVATNISGVNSFADRYRVASSAPTSSLDIGDLYFDTTANELKVYKSSGWSAAGSTVNGTSARFHYNISGTPTTVTGADANGNTLAYDAGFADVYVNGVRMSPDDITITSGTSVVFASALADGDDVDIVAFGTFNVANIVSTGALNSGSITSGFGNIDIGSSTITTTGAISGGTLTGTGLTTSGAIDVQGNEIILDADNDTSITADTDDQIDIKVGGTDTVVISADAMELKGPHPSFSLTDSDDNNYGGLFYNNGAITLSADHGATGATGTLAFQIDGATKASITSAGNFEISGASTLTGGIANFTLITGGVEQEYESGGTNYRSHSFLTPGTHRFSTSTTLTIDFLLVAGGGGSAGAEGQHGSTGGGGAGGLVEATSQTLSPGNYTIVVGAGGAKSTNVSAPASNGGNSTFNSFTATGGAGGGDYEGGTRNGGSGAGGSEDGESGGGTTQDTYSGTTNVTGYGNVGGNGGSYPSGGSGSGGGAGGAGGTANSGTVTGGAGRANSFRTGSNVTYSTGGVGVSGDNIVGVAGSPNTGDGAGGVSTSSGNNTAGEDGGSGIVVIRYAL